MMTRTALPDGEILPRNQKGGIVWRRGSEDDGYRVQITASAGSVEVLTSFAFWEVGFAIMSPSDARRVAQILVDAAAEAETLEEHT